MLKRFQYLGQGGKVLWSDWFEWRSDLKPKYQLERHPRLLNEYKDETEEIPQDLLQGC